MLLILPVSYEFETSMSYKRVIRKLDGELTEYKPTLNILSTGKFMKNHKLDNLYYGRREGEKFQLYYHKAKRRDGGETGFFGKIEKTSNGAKISGSFRKPKYTYVFGIIWAILTIFSALMCLALEQKTGAIVCAAICLAGILTLFWDTKKKYLLGYLRTFPTNDDNE